MKIIEYILLFTAIILVGCVVDSKLQTQKIESRPFGFRTMEKILHDVPCGDDVTITVNPEGGCPSCLNNFNSTIVCPDIPANGTTSLTISPTENIECYVAINCGGEGGCEAKDTICINVTSDDQLICRWRERINGQSGSWTAWNNDCLPIVCSNGFNDIQIDVQPTNFDNNCDLIRPDNTVINLPASGIYTIANVTSVNSGIYRYECLVNGCPVDTQFVVTIYDNPTPTCVGIDIGCSPTSGEVMVVETYSTYQWNDPNNSTTQTVQNLPAGSYTVTVTDQNGCTGTCSAEVTISGGMFSLDFDTTFDCGNGNGTATVNPVGGTPTFTYAWNTTPVQTTQTATGLSAGNYCVTVTDMNGCTGSDCVDILLTDLALNCSKTDANCGNMDGEIIAMATGGTSPYTYTISPTATQSPIGTFTGLDDGTYVITVTDDDGCTATCSIDIIDVGSNFTVPNTITPITCFGANDGTMTLDLSGICWTNIVWSNNAMNTPSQTNISPGIFCATVTDCNGCTGVACRTFSNPAGFSGVQCQVLVQPTCSTGGTAEVTFSGGSPPFTYNWQPSGSTTNPATGLPSGQNCVTVTDNNGCTTSCCVTLQSASNAPSATTDCSNPNNPCQVPCNGTYTTTATTTGGTPNTSMPFYNYLWQCTNGQNGTGETMTVMGGNTSGTFTCNVTVTDAVGCTDIAVAYFEVDCCDCLATLTKIGNGCAIAYDVAGTNCGLFDWELQYSSNNGSTYTTILNGTGSATNTYNATMDGLYRMCLIGMGSCQGTTYTNPISVTGCECDCVITSFTETNCELEAIASGADCDEYNLIITKHSAAGCPSSGNCTLASLPMSSGGGTLITPVDALPCGAVHPNDTGYRVNLSPKSGSTCSFIQGTCLNVTGCGCQPCIFTSNVSSIVDFSKEVVLLEVVQIQDCSFNDIARWGALTGNCLGEAVILQNNSSCTNAEVTAHGSSTPIPVPITRVEDCINSAIQSITGCSSSSISISLSGSNLNLTLTAECGCDMPYIAFVFDSFDMDSSCNFDINLTNHNNFLSTDCPSC